jgi:hypothetical protein
MALHFTGEAPEDQFFTDFGNLNKFQDEVNDISSFFFDFISLRVSNL